MSQPSLDGVFAKLDRGDHHAERLKAATERFLDQNPYRIISDEDPKTGECLIRAQVLKEPPVFDWGARIGDVLFNYRSALDHLAWQLALVNNPSDKPSSRTEFPIFRDPVAFERDRQTKIGGLSWEAQYLVCESQPCHRRQQAHLDWLWSLHELNRTDKHRVLQLVGHQAKSVTFFVEAIQELIGVPEHMLAPVGCFKDGEIISRLPRFEDCSQLTQQLSFAYGIALDPKGPAARGVPLDLALDRWGATLRDEIVPKFEKFFTAQR